MAPAVDQAATGAAPAQRTPPGAMAALGGPQPRQGGSPAAGQPLAKAPRPLLIYTANIRLAVFEAVKGLDAVEELARVRGGYLVRRTNNSISIRIPAELFESVLAEVTKLGDQIQRDVSAQDVTEEFRDLDIRLKNLTAVRERLQKLLDQAKNVQEALAVERELERVTSQIEQLKGRLKMLSHLIAYSTINVAFEARPVERIDPIVELPFRWVKELGLQRLLQL